MLAATASGPATLPIPRELPAGTPAFTGRDAELANLDTLLPKQDTGQLAAVVISAIAGTAGVGNPIPGERCISPGVAGRTGRPSALDLSAAVSQRGRLDLACQHWRQAVVILDELQDPKADKVRARLKAVGEAALPIHQP